MARQIVVEVVGDAKKFTATISDATSKTGKFDNVLKGIGQGAGIAGFFAVQNVTQKVIDVIGDAINAANEMKETLSKSGVVFGTSAKDIEKFGDTTAKSLGISKRSAIEAAATFGNLFVNLDLGQPKAAAMSKALVILAGDLASFNNIDPTVALEKLRAGLAGEAEPLRTLGVFLTEAKVKAKAMEMGLVGLNGELTEAAKVQARYALIMEETTTAQGDFARTSASASNQGRIMQAMGEDLSATFGEKLTPAVEEFQRAVILALDRSMISFSQLESAATSGSMGAQAQFRMLEQVAKEMGLSVEETWGLMAETGQRTATGIRTAMREATFAIRDSEWASAVEDAAQEMPTEFDEAREDTIAVVKRSPSDFAAALREQRTTWQESVDQLAQDLEGRMSTASEIALLKAELAGDNISKGLRSKDPVVKAQAEATAGIIASRLIQLGVNPATDWGSSLGANFARGLGLKYTEVDRQADYLAKAAARNLEIRSPAKEGPLSEHGGPEQWGRNLGQSYADGLKSKGGAVKNAADFLAWVAAQFLKVLSPAEQGPLSKNGGPEAWGRNFGTSWADGVQSAMGAVKSSVNLTAAAAVPGGSLGGGGGGVVVNINGPIYGGPAGLDELTRDIASRLRVAG